MAGRLCVVVLLLCGTLIPFVTGDACEGYFDAKSQYQAKKYCDGLQVCCGKCESRYCCSNIYWQMTKSQQDSCTFSSSSSSSGSRSTFTIWAFVVIAVILVIVFICCCVCPCCCLYSMCRKPRPVIATTSHTTVVNTQFTQQPVLPYQYPAYQPVPVHPGYGAQPQPGYGGGQPMPIAPGYQGQPFQPGPPPTYQETGPAYPAQQPAYPAYPAQQPAYPAQQPAYPAQAGAPPAQSDFLSAQPAYNPAFVDSQPPKTGY